MITKPHLTAVQRKSRKKIRELIRDGRIIAANFRAVSKKNTAQLLDDLADIAEKYLEGLK